MNWMPLLFFDDVCHQLRKTEFNKVSQLSGSWPSFSAEHGEKRREFGFRCRVSNQEVSYNLQETHNIDRADPPGTMIADLNLKFDRITSFSHDFAHYSDHRVSLSEFESVVLPTIAPLVTNCSWSCRAPERSALNRFFFIAFKNCPGFRDITVQEQGEESRDFVTRQVALGNVQRLTLYGTGSWPEAENLTETLKIFVSSAKFHQLYSRHPLRDDYELFELFLERALAKELKRGAFISTAAENLQNLDENRLLALHPECRHDSTKDAWRISDSITLRYLDGMLYVRVE